MRRKFTKLLKIAVAVALVSYLISLIDWPTFLNIVKGVQKDIFVWYLVFQTLAILLSVKKWQVVATVRQMSFSFWEGVRVYLFGMFLNNFFPSVVGGDIYRGRFLSKKYGGSIKGYYTVLFERLQGLWLILFLVTPFWFSYTSLVEESPFLSTVVVIFLVAFIATVFFMAALRFSIFKQYIQKITYLPQQKIIALLKDYQECSWRRGLGTTFAFIICGPVLSNYFLFLSLGIEIPFAVFFFLILFGALLSSIPISFGNIGVKEGAYALLFVPLGSSLEAVVAAAVLSRVVQLLFSLLALPEYLLRKEEKVTV
jgi:uncharacterized protein (TIRG00374 family)